VNENKPDADCAASHTKSNAAEKSRTADLMVCSENFGVTEDGSDTTCEWKDDCDLSEYRSPAKLDVRRDTDSFDSFMDSIESRVSALQIEYQQLSTKRSDHEVSSASFGPNFLLCQSSNP
jgi:hypothetical protein